MDTKVKHAKSYWGTKTNFGAMISQINKIGPLLEENADANDQLGRLNEAI
jgi:indole-3-acetate monooxygenase